MRLHRLVYSCALTLVFALTAATPAAAAGGESEARIRKLFGTFLAPCCWSESLAVHRSPPADELRAQIRAWAAAGWTDDRIKAEMVKAYGRRILMDPDGQQGRVLSAIPWVALALGAGLVALAILRSVRRRPAAEAGAAADLPDEDLY